MNRAKKLFQKICIKHGVSRDEMRGEARTKRIVEARREFYFKASRMGLSSTQVANIINKDPSTIRHHLRKINSPLQRRKKSPFIKFKSGKISSIARISNYLIQKVNA